MHNDTNQLVPSMILRQLQCILTRPPLPVPKSPPQVFYMPHWFLIFFIRVKMFFLDSEQFRLLPSVPMPRECTTLPVVRTVRLPQRAFPVNFQISFRRKHGSGTSAGIFALAYGFALEHAQFVRREIYILLLGSMRLSFLCVAGFVVVLGHLRSDFSYGSFGIRGWPGRRFALSFVGSSPLNVIVPLG